MILHQPEIENQDNSVLVTARVESSRSVQCIPDSLWFRFPTEYQYALNSRSDGFVTGLLLAAMTLHEDIEVCGVVSPKLLYGIETYQQVFLAWFPKQLSHVNIHCETIAPSQPVANRAVGAAFSGGIDSLYTLWSHLPHNQPLAEHQITHCLFLHGFDISLLHQEDYQLAYTRFASVLKRLDIPLIACQTNVHSFTEGLLKWDYAHGTALLSPVLLLSSLFERFYIPSSFTYSALSPWGSSVVIDHLLSTEATQIIHHGASMTKLNKLEAIEGWRVARENMRVCTDSWKRRGVQNCSHCYKCVRTMISLDILGKLQDFQTFNHHITLIDKLRWAFNNSVAGRRTSEIIVYAKARRRWGYLPLLWMAVLAGWGRHWVKKLMPERLFQMLKQHYYPPHKNPFMHTTLQKQTREKNNG